jgi:hypothetical protein
MKYLITTVVVAVVAAIGVGAASASDWYQPNLPAGFRPVPTHVPNMSYGLSTTTYLGSYRLPTYRLPSLSSYRLPTYHYRPTYSGSIGGFNAAGFPKNQYVRPYIRSDGTSVNGYWRNSPTDGLPTCQFVSC